MEGDCIDFSVRAHVDGDDTIRLARADCSSSPNAKFLALFSCLERRAGSYRSAIIDGGKSCFSSTAARSFFLRLNRFDSNLSQDFDSLVNDLRAPIVNVVVLFFVFCFVFSRNSAFYLFCFSDGASENKMKK